MRLTIFGTGLTLLATLATAGAPQKQVIISYPDDTPSALMEEAKHAIIEAGGVVVHEYHLIKAFVAKAPAKALETIHALGEQADVVIEEDQPVTVQKS